MSVTKRNTLVLFRVLPALLFCFCLACFSSADAGAPLRIGISLSDIPNLSGVPDAGFEGVRFGGYMLYDSLIEWDLSSASEPSALVPGLAISWTVDAAKTRWTFKLRDAKFHDGSSFNADAVIWNLDSLLNPRVPQYNAGRAATGRARTISISSYGKIDDHTVYIDTARPNAFFPSEIASLFFVSPARFAAIGSDWSKFARDPSGTGPYVFVSATSHQSLVLQANTAYWNPERIPKTDQTVIMPIPDPDTRVAALRSGQIDMIDTVPPDSIASLKQAGFIISTNVYPHTWMWRVNFLPSSPFSDIRVRKAANLAIDRQAMAELLYGTGLPAKGFAPPDSPWFGHPSFAIKYDPDTARKLLAQAGYGPNKPVMLTVLISSSGGGQMLPLTMNELIQQDLQAVGIDVTYKVMDFATLIAALRGGAKADHADAINIAMTMQEPSFGIVSYGSIFAPPHGTNWGFYDDPAFDAAIKVAQNDFDPVKQEQDMAHVNEVLTDDAAAILVVHDLGPRAMSPKVHGFIHARNWYQDYTSIVVGP